MMNSTQVIDEHRAYIGELIAQLNATNTRIAELEAAQRWISVDERLPEVGQWVLVLIDAETLVFQFMGGSWSNEDEYIFAVSDVTHWMPLPPPPVTDATP